MSRWTRGFAAGLVALGGACTDATDVELLQVPDAAVVGGVAFLDMNGNGVADSGDEPLENAAVVLAAASTGSVVLEATTDTLGLFVFTEVPLGTYELELGAATLGDSLSTVSSTPTVTVEYGDVLQIDLGATYPTLTLAEARAAAEGRRVFTHGIALNTRQSNGDGVVHLQTGATYLRATNVAPVNVAPGDSVRLLGTTASESGQPTIDQVTLLVLRQNAVFLSPPLVTIAEADAATAAASDAALVRIGAAEIGDTATVGGHLLFWAHEGPDSIQVLLRDFLQISPIPALRPDTVVRLTGVRGLLVPYIDASGPRWRLLPRSGADIATENKFADIGVGVSFTPAAATSGETVEIRVTVANGPGPQATHTATNVAVESQLPAGLTFLSASATRGTYDEVTGLWSVGDLARGAAADTLAIQVEVTAGPGTVTHDVSFEGLVREVELNPGNNSDSADLPVS